MIAPHKPEPELEQPEDDLGLDLDLEDKESDGDRDESSFVPEGDEDLELDGIEEVIGLDAPNGLDEEPADDEAALGEDEGSWLDEGQESEVAADDGDDEDSERWTEGSEPAGDEGFDDDLDLEDGARGGEDTGDEGFADEQLLTGLDVESLPPLDEGSGDEEDADPIERELLEELAAAVPDDAPSEDTPRGTPVWTRLRQGPAPTLLSAAGELCVAWDAGLWLAGSGDGALAKASAPGTVAHALATCTGLGGGPVQLALATPHGVCVSRDGGRSFALPVLDEGPRGVPAFVAFTRDAAGTALWAAAPFGKLQVLREGGEALVDAGVELPVAKLASDGAQSLLIVGRSDDGALRAVMSRDGGRSFKPLALPADSVERVQLAAIAGDTWLCSRRGLRPQLLWGRRGEAGLPLGASATPPVALSVERGVPCAYLCESEAGRAQLLRVELSVSAKTPRAQVLAELPSDLGTPLQLVVSSDARGNPLVHVAGTKALYRMVLAPLLAPTVIEE